MNFEAEQGNFHTEFSRDALTTYRTMCLSYLH
jgi:hypothetical protein